MDRIQKISVLPGLFAHLNANFSICYENIKQFSQSRIARHISFPFTASRAGLRARLTNFGELSYSSFCRTAPWGEQDLSHASPVADRLSFRIRKTWPRHGSGAPQRLPLG